MIPNVDVWIWPIIGALGAVGIDATNASVGGKLDHATVVPLGVSIGIAIALAKLVQKGQKWVDRIESTLKRHSENLSALKTSIDNLPCPGRVKCSGEPKTKTRAKAVPIVDTSDDESGEAESE